MRRARQEQRALAEIQPKIQHGGETLRFMIEDLVPEAETEEEIKGILRTVTSVSAALQNLYEDADSGEEFGVFCVGAMAALASTLAEWAQAAAS